MWKDKARGTALCDYTCKTYYCVIIVFGEPLFMQTVHNGEAVIYTDKELEIAEQVLKDRGITKFKRLEIGDSNLSLILDWQP